MDTLMREEIQEEYEAIDSGVAILPRRDAAPLSLRGADRADFLHRMTTNDINGLRPGQATVTVLTSSTARILHVFSVLCREDELLLLPQPGESDELAAHLRGQIFFMDQVEVHLEQKNRWRIVGPRAKQALASMEYAPADSADGRWWQIEEALFLQQDGFGIPGFEAVAPDAGGADWLSALEESGARLLRDDVAYRIRRVELGIPAAGHELTRDYNPLEVGLAWTCSDSKGCYTGQEIIARQITYDKVTKKLVGLLCKQSVHEGSQVQVDGKTVGTVTSAAFSPAMDAEIALAVVHRAYTAPGGSVTVRGADDAEIAATVTELPFRDH